MIFRTILEPIYDSNFPSNIERNIYPLNSCNCGHFRKMKKEIIKGMIFNFFIAHVV